MQEMLDFNWRIFMADLIAILTGTGAFVFGLIVFFVHKYVNRTQNSRILKLEKRVGILEKECEKKH